MSPRWWLLLGLLLVCRPGLGFPELTRHGYARCTTCHFSPNGGGIPTAYGRALSTEVLSTWGTETEGEFLHGAISLPEWLQLGGDFRFVQTHRETPAVRSGRAIVMQADLEAAVTVGRWDFVGTVGYQDEFLSRRHYARYRISDDMEVRAGRFQTAYGINTPDHILEIKRGLGWDQGTETYNVEGSFYTDWGELFLTGVLGRPDRPSLNAEKGVALRGALSLGDSRYKAGLSYFYGAQTGADRQVFGPYAILGFREDLFLLAELDFQHRNGLAAPGTWGVANYLRLDYEFVRGWHVFIAQEFSRWDLSDPTQERMLGTAGLQIFPRPHFEFLLAYQRQGGAGVPGGADFLWGMFHYYL